VVGGGEVVVVEEEEEEEVRSVARERSGLTPGQVDQKARRSINLNDTRPTPPRRLRDLLIQSAFCSPPSFIPPNRESRDLKCCLKRWSRGPWGERGEESFVIVHLRSVGAVLALEASLHRRRYVIPSAVWPRAIPTCHVLYSTLLYCTVLSHIAW